MRVTNSGVSPSHGFPLENPLGSKDPNNRVLGPKYYSMNGMRALKPSYLGPWTLRECVGSMGWVLSPPRVTDHNG